MRLNILNRRYTLLAGIIFLAFVLRIFRVTTIPPGLSWDEVSIGYNAYSILKTGRDEHGRLLPLDAFIAFGDYKPTLSIYLTVPTIALFGLNEFAVRLPSVIAGTLMAGLTYFLVNELLGLSTLALLAAAAIAISPWHIQLSRAGFEANIATFLIVFGVVLVLLVRRFTRLLIICWLPLVAAIYTFNSARYFAPLIVVALLFYQRRTLVAQIQLTLAGAFLACLMLLPIMPHLVSPQSRLRFKEVNIFSDSSIVETANRRIQTDGNSWWSKLLHNRRLGYARSYLIHFFDNLEPWFLFARGDGNPKFSLQDTGQLYLFEAPFLVLGFLWLWQKKRSQAILLSFWLLAAIIPAATARETPHALRIENSLPVWQIVIAAGLMALVEKLRGKIKILGAIVIGGLYLGNFAYFRHNYFNHYAREFSGEWQYGYREAIRFVVTQKTNYDRVVLSEAIGRPYIYVLFYEQTDPKQLSSLLKASFDAAGFYNVTQLGKYKFVRDGVDQLSAKTLYVLPPQQVPANAKILETIYLLNGRPALVIFTSS